MVVCRRSVRVSQLVPRARVLTGPDATSRTVLAALPRHRIVHLACHGRSGRDDPATATLLLHDHTTEPLTLREISALRLAGAELAYLSACETTLGPALLVDEAVRRVREAYPRSPAVWAGFVHVGV